jgi:hypothetical protein
VTRRVQDYKSRRAPGHIDTPLERLLNERNISPARLAAKLRERLGDQTPKDQIMRRWRFGRAEPRRKNWIRLLWAIRELANDSSIQIADIVDLDPDNTENWKD